MPNESYFLAFGGLGLSLAGFAGLISTLTRRPAANPVLAAYGTRTIVFLGFSLTFAGFGTVAAFGLLGPDVQPAVRVGTLVMLVSFLRGLLIDTRPGPIWPDERERWGSIAVLAVMAAVTLGNLAVASVGYLQVVMMLGLIGPVTIFYNTIRDASLAGAEVDDPQRPKRGRSLMLTATKDLMLPATVTGSWPRPRWYDGGLWGRPLDTALLDVRFREQFLDAHATVLADQERAGLDILTNGDYHLDEDFAGRSWHHYPLQRWKGFEHEELQYEGSRDSLLAFPAGTLMNEIETTWRWPRVVGKVEHDPKNPLEYGKLWRIAQARAASGKPVKFGTCSSQVLAIFLDSHTADYDLDDKKQLIWDMAGAMNLELRQLAAAGAKVIQIEEPTIHFTAAFHPEETELLDFMVDAFNHEVDGLDDIELWIHTCWGNPNMQKVYSGESYANSIDIYLNRLKGDVWTVEATENDLAEIDLFKPYADNLTKKVAVGMVSHRTLQADMAPTVAGRIRRALEVIPADKLILSSDCGFGRQGFNRTVAFYKATGIAQGRNIVLKELGLPERYVAAADPALQTDVLPDREPLTHLPSPWT